MDTQTTTDLDHKIESRHLDSVSIGIMTISTIIIVGMFGILQLTGESDPEYWAQPWLVAIGGAAVPAYVLTLAFGSRVILSSTLQQKAQDIQALILTFFMEGMLVGITATLTILTRIEG